MTLKQKINWKKTIKNLPDLFSPEVYIDNQGRNYTKPIIVREEARVRTKKDSKACIYVPIIIGASIMGIGAAIGSYLGYRDGCTEVGAIGGFMISSIPGFIAFGLAGADEDYHCGGGP